MRCLDGKHMRTPVRLSAIFLVCMAACDMAPGPEPTASQPARLQDFSMTPQRLVYALLPAEQIIGDSIAVALTISVTAFGGEGVRVRYVVQTPESSLRPLGSGDLTAAGQGRHTATVNVTISALDVRTYTILVYAVDNRERIVSEVRGQLEYVRVFEPGSPPVIDSLIVPATIQRPAEGQPSRSLSLVAIVSDADGLGNIEIVEFWNKNTPSAKIAMCDRGGARPCGGSAESGDLVAGDGRFTRRVFIASTNELGVNTLVFQATDRAGLKSDTMEANVEIVQ